MEEKEQLKSAVWILRTLKQIENRIRNLVEREYFQILKKLKKVVANFKSKIMER